MPKGGREFDATSVHSLLIHPLYIGRIKHKTKPMLGQHEAIIDEEIFEQVQALLRENNINRSSRLPGKSGGLLKGLIRCPNCNVAMVHNITRRKTRSYRYYTCLKAIKRGRKACTHPSLPAAEIEAAVIYRQRGWYCVPLKPRSKSPSRRDWTNLRLAPDVEQSFIQMCREVAAFAK